MSTRKEASMNAIRKQIEFIETLTKKCIGLESTNPKYAHILTGIILNELVFVDCPDPQLPFDSRYERRTLK